MAAALEAEFLRRGCGCTRAPGRRHRTQRPKFQWTALRSSVTTGGVATGTHAVLAIGSIPTATGSASTPPGGCRWRAATSRSPTTPVERAPHLRGRDLSGSCRCRRVASMQGRKIAEHVMGLHTRSHRHLDYGSGCHHLHRPEIADVGLAEAERFAEAASCWYQVPCSANAKALIEGELPRLRKIISTRPTGSSSGARSSPGAAELIFGPGPGRDRQPEGHRPGRLCPGTSRSRREPADAAE